MDEFIIYLLLFSIILICNQIFQKSTLAIPIPLILVVVGMCLSFIPFFPTVKLPHELVLNLFLPLLIYEISAFSSWRDMKKQFRPIALLSIGHVLFITLLVAIVIHTMLPQIGWPLAIVLGAIISPPDDVAIVSIAEKIHMPERIFIILEGEGMFNDAAALTIFRFALVASLSSQFSISYALTSFIFMIIGETIYGLLLGHIIGYWRTKITNTSLHVIASFLTPFFAYLPMVKLGGSGIVATAVVGFVIGNQFTLRFTPAYRLTALTIWPTLAFAIQSLIFLLVGLDLRPVYLRISSIPLSTLLAYVIAVLLVVIIGRFIWVYGFVIALPRLIFPKLSRRDPYPPWQYPFIISWAGMRGGISLAAALAIPTLPFIIDGVSIEDLLVFLVFSVIFVTLVLQGLSLPFIMKKLGIDKIGRSERYQEHLSELQTRVQMINAALDFLHQQKIEAKYDKQLQTQLSLHIHEYQMLKNQFETRILAHDHQLSHDEETEVVENVSLLHQLITVEKDEVTRLWRENKINLRTRNKLVAILDHQIERHLI